MIDQKQKIRSGEWDALIVLDACRYDYFADTYKKYLSGKLVKANSPASGTFKWLRSVFGNYFDATIFGSHPVLNSLGIPR